MLRPSVFASPKVCSDLLTCVTTSVAPCKPEGLAAAPRTKVQLLRGEGTRCNQWLTDPASTDCQHLYVTSGWCMLVFKSYVFFRVDVETTGRTGWRLVNSTTTAASATPVLPPRRIASNLVNFRGSTSCPTGYQDIQNWSVASVTRNGTGNGGTATLPWACYPDFRWFSCRFPVCESAK